MSKAGLIGLVGGFACILVGILLGGRLQDFADAASVFIVLGGTICSTLISVPAKQLKSALKAAKMAYRNDQTNVIGSIDMIINMANTSRREGLLSLENMTEEIKDPYLKKGIMLIVDGSDPELVKSVMETEISYMEARHSANANVFLTAAAYAPAYGMIGTLIGLINMLVNLNDSAALGPAMSVALVTTFYGVIVANLVCTPIAKKLKAYSSNEQLQKEMILEGILSIQDGENPRIIQEKLESFLANSDSKLLEESRAKEGGEEE